jgi:uncharacterized protein YcbK (DUF882 family)
VVVAMTANGDVVATLGRDSSRNSFVSSVAGRGRPLVMRFVRVGARVGVAGFFLLAANDALQTAAADGDTETLSFHHLHTKENITITFKRNGIYDQAALKKLDWFMRDWRKEKATRMDPHLYDLLWQVYHEVGATEPIQVVCGYRSPGTNSMLRARSRGVAKFSQHIHGQAMDFYIPGVALSKVRAAGLRLQRGGVGFYPTSGSPFVHMDTGNIRHWPRIARSELLKIFPNGRTVHVPSDGKPLRNYALALADVERRGAVPSGHSLELARESGVITASQEQEAATPHHKPTVLAKIFRGKDTDAEEDEVPKGAPKPAQAPLAVASLSPPAPANIPLPAARPAAAIPVVVAAVVPKPRPQEIKTYVTASLPRNIFDKRAVWHGAFESEDTPPPPAHEQAPYEIASIGAAPASNTPALGYATEQNPPAVARARPMGSTRPRVQASEAKIIPTSRTPIPTEQPHVTAMVSSGNHSGDPWLRAAMLTPSVRFMTATRSGSVDRRWQTYLLDRPEGALEMTFSADPHFGMVADRFDGRAVVFLATTTFAPQEVQYVASISRAESSRSDDARSESPQPASRGHAAKPEKPGALRQALNYLEGILSPAHAR